MKQVISTLLLCSILVNNVNVIDLILHFTDRKDKSELAFDILLCEESEKSKEENKSKEKAEDEQKYLQRHLLNIPGSGSINLNDFNQQTAHLESLSYKEALIQPPDFI